MRLAVCLFFVISSALSVSALLLETCSNASDCSESFSVRCDEMARSWVERGGKQFLVSCIYGTCSCNFQLDKSRVLDSFGSSAKKYGNGKEDL